MNRSELLAAKAVEVTESLQGWARGILGPGEQIVVSFQVQNIPVLVLNLEDSGEVGDKYLDMELLDFFSLKRLEESEERSVTATRTRNCLINELYELKRESGIDKFTLRSFLARCDVTYLLRTPNFGRKSLWLVQRTLEKVGLTLQDHIS